MDMAKYELIKDRGHVTKAGTDWPIGDYLYRSGPREWTILYGLCNGVASTSSGPYRSRRAALAGVSR